MSRIIPPILFLVAALGFPLVGLFLGAATSNEWMGWLSILATPPLILAALVWLVITAVRAANDR